MYYQPQSNQLYLANNAGTAWLTPALTPGVAGMVSNSQCTLDAGSSSVSMAGNNLYVNLALTFGSSFVGSKNVYGYAVALDGTKSVWYPIGTWLPHATAGPPTIMSLTPNTGSGSSVTFQAVYMDPNGASDLNEILLQVNTTRGAANACYVYYQPQANQLYLANNAGTVWMTPALTPGVAGTASNNQCTLDAGSSSVSLSGNSLTLNVALSFDISTTVVGKKNVYLYAGAISGQNSGWVQEGTWTPYTANASASIISLSPNSGAGTSLTFTVVASDPYGAADFAGVELVVNTTAPPNNAGQVAHACAVALGNGLSLSTDSGGFQGSLTIGQPGTLSNSQCTLDAGLSSISISGNNMTLNIALSFTSKFTGSQNVYVDAFGKDAADTGYLLEGTWTPNGTSATPPPAIVSLSPAMGSGTSVTFQAVYSDPAGASVLSEVFLNVDEFQQSSFGCYVYYQPSANLLYLAADDGSWPYPGLTPGVAGTVSNSLCTLNAGSSSVSLSGNDLTLNASLTFKSGVGQAKSVFLYAGGGGLNSGWVNKGTWTP